MQKADTLLSFSGKESIRNLQLAFNKAYPFLKIEFYRDQLNKKPGHLKYLQSSLPLSAAGLKQQGNMMISDSMTVNELEEELKKLGLKANAFRKSGRVWLEISMTGNWTLGHQNTHGRELTEPSEFESIHKKEISDNSLE